MTTKNNCYTCVHAEGADIRGLLVCKLKDHLCMTTDRMEAHGIVQEKRQSVDCTDWKEPNYKRY